MTNILNRRGNVLFLFVFALMATACSSKSSETQNTTTLTDPAPQTGSCSFKVDQGESTNFELLYSSETTTTLFDKTYNRSWLDAVLKSSIANTIPFITSTGVAIYQSPAVGGGCDNFNSLPRMPSDINAHWKNLTRDEKSSHEYLMGLYLPKGSSPAILSSNKNKAAIVLRNDGQRWTLVHEFMHHNFYTEAVKNGYDDETIKKDGVRIEKKLESILKGRLSAQERCNQGLPAYGDFVTLLDKFITHYTLEEITIESILRDKYESGEFRYVPREGYNNAARYIYSSAKRAEKLYSYFSENYNNLISQCIAQPETDQASLDKANEIARTIRARLAEISSYANQFSAASVTISGELSFEAEAQPEAPCSHSEAAERHIDNLIKKLKRFI